MSCMTSQNQLEQDRIPVGCDLSGGGPCTVRSKLYMSRRLGHCTVRSKLKKFDHFQGDLYKVRSHVP